MSYKDCSLFRLSFWLSVISMAPSSLTFWRTVATSHSASMRFTPSHHHRHAILKRLFPCSYFFGFQASAQGAHSYFSLTFFKANNSRKANAKCHGWYSRFDILHYFRLSIIIRALKFYQNSIRRTANYVRWRDADDIILLGLLSVSFSMRPFLFIEAFEFRSELADDMPMNLRDVWYYHAPELNGFWVCLFSLPLFSLLPAFILSQTSAAFTLPLKKRATIFLAIIGSCIPGDNAQFPCFPPGTYRR